MFRIERRDVASVLSRANVLLERVDRFLKTTAPERLAGTGFAIAGGRLVVVRDCSTPSPLTRHTC
jgi:hypothetical protein